MLAIGAVVAVACSDAASSTSPVVPLSGVFGGNAKGGDSGATGGDTSSTGGGDTSSTGGGDSSSTGGGDSSVVGDTVIGSLIPGVHGRTWAPSGTSSDTTIYQVVAGVQVQVMTQPASGGTPAIVATLTSDTAGYYKVDPIADGTYQARAIPPAGTGFRPAQAVNIIVKQGRMIGYAEVNLVFTRP